MIFIKIWYIIRLLTETFKILSLFHNHIDHNNQFHRMDKQCTLLCIVYIVKFNSNFKFVILENYKDAHSTELISCHTVPYFCV